MGASHRAADLIDEHRPRIIDETLMVLGERIPFMRGLDEADRRKSAATILVGLTHLLRGAPLEALVDVVHGVARHRLEAGMSRAELALVSPIYIIGARRGLSAELASTGEALDAIMRSIEDAMLRIADLVNREALGDKPTKPAQVPSSTAHGPRAESPTGYNPPPSAPESAATLDDPEPAGVLPPLLVLPFTECDPRGPVLASVVAGPGGPPGGRPAEEPGSTDEERIGAEADHAPCDPGPGDDG